MTFRFENQREKRGEKAGKKDEMNETGSSRTSEISIQVDVTEIETRIRYPERSTNRIEITDSKRRESVKN